jgi:hypothetical protein
MRTWIEGGFKDTKRGGGPRHQTTMTDPARASRLGLALAVAPLWVVRVGGEAEANLPCSTLEELPALHIARRSATKRSRPRLRRCFAQGMLLILVSVVQSQPVPLGRFLPEPWPTTLVPRKPPKARAKDKKTKSRGQKQRWRTARRAFKAAS